MGMFIIGSLVMVIVAVLIVYLPMRRTSLTIHSHDQINQQLVKERLDEIAKENQDGLLSEQDKDAAQQELKLAFVDEQESLTSSDVAKRKPVSTVFLGLILAIGMAVSAVVYWKVNELDNIDHWLNIAQSSKTLQSKLEQGVDLTREDLIDIALGVRTKLIEQPTDATAWQWLGRIYTTLQRPDMAIDAMERALKLQPSDPIILENYARVLLLEGTETSFGRAKRVLFRLLDIQPNSQNGLAMLGLAAESLGDNNLALDAWQALKEQLGPDDPLNQIVARQLAKLQGGNTPVASASASNSDDEEGVQLNLTISLSKEFSEKVGQLPYLFVFAQDGESGNRMPAAVVRIPTQAFPVEVSLTNANSMVPGFNLSSLKTARLVARLSVDENVGTSPGELEGELSVSMTEDKEVRHTILINKEIL